jgi:Bacterial Ig domain
VRLRALSSYLAVAALVAAGVTFSGAAFTAASANSGNAFSAANAFNLTATMNDPGANLRLTVLLTASAADGEDGSSITDVTIEKSPAGAGTWTTVCTDSSSPYSCSFDTTTVTDGLYDFRATAQNSAGGSATSTLVTNRRVDNTAPTADLTDPGTPLRATVTLDATGADTGGSGIASVKIQRSLAGAGTWTDVCTDASSPYSCDFDTTGVADGLYDLRAVSTDSAGNSTNSSVVANRRIDNTAPSATITNPGSPITGTKTFDGTASDTGSGVASLKFEVSPTGQNTWSDVCTDTTSPYSCNYDTSALADGQYDFRSRATDNAGNTANSTVYSGAIVDNAGPAATMTDPGQYLRGTSVTLGATADDGAGSGVASVKIQRSPAGAGTWTDVCTDTSAPYSCSFDTTAVSDGLYDFRAIATDNVPLSTTSSVVTNRRVDNTVPTATMNDPGLYLGNTVALTASAADTGGSGIGSVTIQRSPAGLGIWTDVCTDTSSPYSCSFDTTAVSDGLYDFRAVALDNAGNGVTSATVANRQVDNTLPTASLSDPGSPLRATVTLNATATDVGGSGVASVAFERSPAGLNTWTNICTDPSFPYSCSFNTTAATDGVYDLRAVATDNSGKSNTSTVANRTIDNTAPTALNIQTTNGGATVGRPEANDTVVFTYSEQLLSTSVLTGWNGTAIAVTVRITNSGNNDQLEVWNGTNTARLPLTNTFVTLNGNFVQTSSTFAATMVQNGASITVTLGAQSGGTVRTEASNVTLSWPSSTTPTDLAGNACTGNTVAEGGAADQDF